MISIRTCTSLLVAVVLLGACATPGPTIVANQDPAADFGQFRTFGFVQPLGTDNGDSRSTLSVRLMAATTRELQARGLQSVSSNPDLLVNFLSAQQTDVASRGMSSSGVFHARTGYTTWSGYDLRTSTTRQITEGMVAIDVVDARRRQLVFEGAARARVTETMQDNIDATISDAVADIFASFPR